MEGTVSDAAHDGALSDRQTERQTRTHSHTHLLVEGTISYAAHHGASPPHNGHRTVSPVQHQPGNVLPRHIRELLAEDVLERNQPEHQTSDIFKRLFKYYG